MASATELETVKGFLGLTGYYRRFIYGYGQVYKPLTNLPKKEALAGLKYAAFQELKTKMVNPHVLSLPNFDKHFLIENDTSRSGMAIILMRDGHPIAYISKAFSSKNSLLSAYESELLAMVFAVQNWQHYLRMHQFVIITDQYSLGYILGH